MVKEMSKPLTRGDMYTAVGILSCVIMSSAGYVIMGTATELWKSFWGIAVVICGLVFMIYMFREAYKEEIKC